MNKIAIIINHQYGNASKNIQLKVDRLKEEFHLLGYEIDVLANDGSLANIENGNIVLNIPKYELVIYLDKDKYLARMLEKAGILLVNNSKFIELCDDKMLTHIALANKGITMPKTIPGPLVFSNQLTASENVMKNVLKEISFPLLIKGVYGSLGQNMVYVENEKEFIEAYDKMKSQPLLFQEYIKESYGRSLRALVVDHKILGVIERYNPNDYRSNFNNGSSQSKEVKLNQEYIDFLNKIIMELDIDYAGVDLLYGKDNHPVLCEINSNAFFKEFEKTTHVNAAKAFALMCLKKLQENKIVIK